jgi:hypothetical protein
MQIGVSTYLPSNEDLLGEYSPKNCSGSNKKILLKSIVVHHNIFVSSSFAYKMIYISDSQPGTRVPLGVCFKFTGGTQADCRKVTTFKSMGKEPILVFLVPKISHFFIWGYNLCQFFILGLRRGGSTWFGGTRVPKGWEPLIYIIIFYYKSYSPLK